MRNSLNSLLELLRISGQPECRFGRPSGWMTSSHSRPIFSLPFLRTWRFKQVASALAVLLLILLASATFLVIRGYREGQEIRDYVGGPFSSQLLYLQGCARGAGQMVARAEADVPATLEEQFNSCRAVWLADAAGYYVYDFNITKVGRSFQQKDIKLWREVRSLSPSRILSSERVEKSQNQSLQQYHSSLKSSMVLTTTALSPKTGTKSVARWLLLRA